MEQRKRKIIYLAGFLFSLPIALGAYINSSFISSFVGEQWISLVYTLGSVCSILALVSAPFVFRKMGGYKFLLLIILLDAMTFLTLALTENMWYIVLSFIFGFALNTLIYFSLDEILEIFSKNSATGKIRGVYLALASSAWILAQLSFAVLLGDFSLKTIYAVAFSIMLLFFLLSLFKLSNIPDPKYDKITSLKYIGKFFKNIHLSRAYGMALLLQFFFCWMIIYTPIYLSVHLGFSWREIGLMFTVMLLPFSIIPFHLGKYADKIGERKILMIGFGITSLSTLLLFFIERHEVWIWAVLLFFTRVGAATIETMIDAYFFKHIKSENEQFVGVYRSASPVAYIVGPLVAFITLLFVPSFNFIYVVLGALVLSGVYLSSTIKKSDI